MPAPAICPGCGTKLAHGCEACPNCPWSYVEASPQKGALQSDTFHNRILPLLLFGGIAAFIWGISQFLWDAANEGQNIPVTLTRDPASAAAPAASNTAAGAPQVPVEEPAEAISIVAEPPRRARKAVTEWRLRGTVYDLLTLKPIPRVQLVFSDYETSARAQIVTDGQGRYRTILPALSGRGYLVALSKNGYATAYLDPATPGITNMPLVRRKELARELSTLVSGSSALSSDTGAPLKTDFYLAPKP